MKGVKKNAGRRRAMLSWLEMLSCGGKNRQPRVRKTVVRWKGEVLKRAKL